MNLHYIIRLPLEMVLMAQTRGYRAQPKAQGFERLIEESGKRGPFPSGGLIQLAVLSILENGDVLLIVAV